MPYKTAAIPQFSARMNNSDFATYRTVYINCGKKSCKQGRHGPYMYGRYQTLEGRWKEFYIGKLTCQTAQALLQRASQRNHNLEEYLLPHDQANPSLTPSPDAKQPIGGKDFPLVSAPKRVFDTPLSPRGSEPPKTPGRHSIREPQGASASAPKTSADADDHTKQYARRSKQPHAIATKKSKVAD